VRRLLAACMRRGLEDFGRKRGPMNYLLCQKVAQVQITYHSKGIGEMACGGSIGSVMAGTSGGYFPVPLAGLYMIAKGRRKKHLTVHKFHMHCPLGLPSQNGEHKQ
jgi:hypothetical protein